jgi:hypothetical protein
MNGTWDPLDARDGRWDQRECNRATSNTVGGRIIKLDQKWGQCERNGSSMVGGMRGRVMEAG